MKMGNLLGLALVLATTCAFSATVESVQSPSESRSSILKKYSSTQDLKETSSDFQSNLDLRTQNKIGVGAQVGGGLGIGGLNLEINVEDINSALMGVGAGPGYGTVQLLWRRSFEGHYFTPYTTLGWARWYNSGAPEDYKKSTILERVLTESQKESGRFGVDFVAASVGMQYQELSGEYLPGASFFAEFALLAPLGGFTPLPTGSLGVMYYF